MIDWSSYYAKREPGYRFPFLFIRVIAKRKFRMERGVTLVFKIGISNFALVCARQIDDELRPDGSKLRLGNHHQSLWALLSMPVDNGRPNFKIKASAYAFKRKQGWD